MRRHTVFSFFAPPSFQGAAEVENDPTESLRLQSQDALASHQSLRSFVGFVERGTATLVSKAWRTARNQQTTRVKCRNITDAAVLALAKGCPNLTTVNLYDCANITDAAVLALAKGCPNLTSIDLAGCRMITEEAKAALRESHEGITIYE